jgi:hypothetical protein
MPPERLDELEAKVAELSESLKTMERRVGLLERGLSPAAARRVRAAAAAETRDEHATEAMLRQDAASVAGTVSLIGRTLLVLAGAYFLRALTDTGRLPMYVGVALGFVYAGIWVLLADRAAGAKKLWSAGFHGAAAVTIGFPLLFETTARFKLVPTWIAALLLSAFTGVALGVAARRRFQPLAWLVVLAAIPAAFALMVAQGRVAPPLLFLVLLGVGTVWLGYILDWRGLRWPVAAAADLAVLFLAVEGLRAGAPDGPVVAVLVQFALVAAYLGSTAVRTLGLRRGIVPFEMVQSAAALLAGLGGAAFVTARAGMANAAIALGLLSLAFGAGAYAVAFAFIERQRTPANFYFYTTAGAVFVLAGASFLLPPDGRGLLWAALAVACALCARRARRATLAGHTATYAAAAAVSGGLLEHAWESAFASPLVPWTPATLPSIGVALAVAVATWAVFGTPAEGGTARVPRVFLLALLAASVTGLLIGWVAPLVGGVPGAGADPGIIATARTVFLALGALGLAAMGRLPAFTEAPWLAWPVLGIAGVKMILEDLPRSRPATLFLAFAVYGAALILVPRLRRRELPAAAPPREAPAPREART